MKRIKRTFTKGEKDLVYDLWKQGAGFSDIGRVIEAKPGSVFTILRETGGDQASTENKEYDSSHK
jgi:hypothetical protein